VSIPVDFSVLLVTDCLATATPALRAYAASNDHWRLEAVLIVVGGGFIAIEEVIALGYAEVQVLDGGDGRLNLAEACGVRAANAPWIVLAQVEHLPRPGYVSAIATALSENNADIAGPVFSVSEPMRRLDRVFLRTAYGLWLQPLHLIPRPLVAAHNSTYRRTILLALGDRLEAVLEAGWELTRSLQTLGCRSCLVHDACIELAAPPGYIQFIRRMFIMGRRSSGQRCSKWILPARIAWAAGTLLLPGVFLARLLIRERAHGLQLPASDLLLIAMGFVAQAAGELVGFLTGPGTQAYFRPPTQAMQLIESSNHRT
jgi:hypothetical protein